MATVTSAGPGRHALPWLVRLGVGVGCLALIVAKDVREHGLERDGAWGLSLPMAVAILVAGVVAAFPFAVIEGVLARRDSHLRIQCLAAAAGAAVVGWFAGLPVGLRFFGSRDPAKQEYIEMAASSFLVMAAAYSLLVLLMRSHRVRVRSRR
ncbi:hypothetical protein [Aeromicrobium wangtongii]|uniref:Uncharacterized protein n=1 Tax=Aeromicrobium wangtongii TaxID=2969247 RepID=A0ABY5M3N3_9ACTN|nr:hypothetical protein [Aeromicrobium wangtongii]MCD9199170.1 hypothetical protein [Aeromicrobium wangtongii]UUP12800.1 hypothetical protein NQV15_13175 [Aeromicrobium wangtongii]